MERMRNALIKEFKKLNHEDKKLVLTFVRQLVDATSDKGDKRLRRCSVKHDSSNK